MYTDLYIKQKKSRFPIFVSVVLVIVVSSFLFLITQDSAPTRASKKSLISHEIVNVSPTQIGVLWEADQADEGWILWGESPNSINQIALDERDIVTSKIKRRYHLAIIRNLQPNTEYFYNIVSDNEVIKQVNGESFKAKTLSESFVTNNISPIYGKMAFENGAPAANAISMVIVGNAYPVISLSSQSGEWLNSLTYMASKETLNPINISDNTPITIQLFTDQERSMIRSTPSSSRPIPQIVILGNNYSFITRNSILGETTKNFLTYSSNSNDEKNNQKVRNFEVRYPTDNAIIPGSAPIIKGYGLAGQQVRVKINDGFIFDTNVTVNTLGEWSVSLSRQLLHGTYTLTADSVDSRNKKKSISRIFTIIKSGEQVLGEQISTPSASLTPRVVNSPTKPPLLTVTRGKISASPTLTQILGTVTPTYAVVDSATPTLQVTIVPSQIPEPPVSGANIIPYLLGGLGIVLIGIGSAVVF